jgi:hypothetical protein
MKRTRALSISFVLAVALGACADEGSTVTPGNKTSPIPSPTTCINETDFLEHRDNVTDQIDKLSKALRSYDLSGTVGPLRVASSEVRSMADQIADVDPEAQGHFLRSADALDNAATAFSDGDLTNANSYLDQGVNEVRQAVDAVTVSMYC